MAITKLGNYLLKLAAMDESALAHARELLELIRANRLSRDMEEEFQIGTLPEDVANEIYRQMGSDYQHSGNAAWALALNDLRHISRQHMNPKNADKETQTTIDGLIGDIRNIGVAADNGNLASAVSYNNNDDDILNIGGVYISAKYPAVWSEDPKHIVNGMTPFAFLNMPRNGVFHIRTQYPAGLEYARGKRNSKPISSRLYMPENELLKLKHKK